LPLITVVIAVAARFSLLRGLEWNANLFKMGENGKVSRVCELRVEGLL